MFRFRPALVPFSANQTLRGQHIPLASHSSFKTPEGRCWQYFLYFMCRELRKEAEIITEDCNSLMSIMFYVL